MNDTALLGSVTDITCKTLVMNWAHHLRPTHVCPETGFISITRDLHDSTTIRSPHTAHCTVQWPPHLTITIKHINYWSPAPAKVSHCYVTHYLIFECRHHEAVCLSVLLDSSLTFASHARRLDDKSFYHLRQMNTVRKSLTEDAATTMVHAFVTSRLDYCNCVLHRVSAASVHPLQNVLNAAARIILRKWKFDHISTDVRDRLHWLPVQQRIEYKVCVLVYKCLRQAAPTYLAELCSPVSESANRGHLRSAARVPCSSTLQNNEIGQRSFAVSGPTLWNSLPLSVRDPSLTLTQFCARLKTVLFCRALWNTSIAPTCQFRL